MGSLILYLLAFSYSAFIAYYIQKKYKFRGKEVPVLFKFLSAFAIMLIPILLACVRKDIGIDYSTYQDLFKTIHETELKSYTEELGSLEFLNKPLVDLGYFLAGNVRGVFAIYSILTLIIYEMSLINFQKRISLPIATLVLLFILYSAALNIVRQSLAIAVVFYSTIYIIQRKPGSFFLFALVATLIHSSAVVSILFYFLYYHKETKFKTIFSFIIILLPIFIVTRLSSLAEFQLFERYADVYEEENIDISISYIVKIPTLVLLVLSYKKIKIYPISSLLYKMYLMELVLLFSASIFKWAFRLSFYPYIAQILLMGLITKYSLNSKLYRIIIPTWYCIYFIVLYYLWGRDEIFPYKHF